MLNSYSLKNLIFFLKLCYLLNNYGCVFLFSSISTLSADFEVEISMIISNDIAAHLVSE